MDVREEAINRMLRILEQFSQKLKITLCLPEILDSTQFKSIFELRDIDDLKKLRELCIEVADWQDQQISMVRERHLRNGPMRIAPRDLDLRNNLLWAMISEILSKYEAEILFTVNESANDIPPSCRMIIEHVELMKEIMERQMRMTPKMLRMRKVELRNAEAAIARAQEEIEKIETENNEEEVGHEQVVEKSRDETNDLNRIIDELKKKRSEELDHEKNCYKNTVRGIRRDYMEEENCLKDRLNAHEVMLEELIHANVEREKSLREHCIKMEKKCLAARNAYDRDLSKLSELKKTLETQLVVTDDHYETLKNERDVQSVLYLNLKRDCELAVMAAFAERLSNFERNRAARIIQRTWRGFHERQLAAKKKKRHQRRNK